MISLPTRSSNEEKTYYKSRPEKEAFKALCSKAQEFPKDRKKRRHAKGKEEQRAKKTPTQNIVIKETTRVVKMSILISDFIILPITEKQI